MGNRIQGIFQVGDFGVDPAQFFPDLSKGSVDFLSYPLPLRVIIFADGVPQFRLSALLFALGSLAALFLIIGLFRLISSVIGVTPTYAAIGGIFLVAGVFLWLKRTKPPKELT